MLKVDQEKLLTLFKDFYALTGAQICIFDDAFQEILRYPLRHCEFCHEIRKDPNMLAQCNQCDRYAFEKCRQTKKRYTYRCHMRLIETATPLIYENAIIGYIMIGNIADSQSDFEGLTVDPSLLCCYNAIPHLTDEKIGAASHIADACASYLYVSDLISSQSKTLAQKINEYIRIHLDKNITVDMLCNTFRISRSELYHTFFKLFNNSVANHIKSCRLNYAKELLLKTDLPIHTIAEKCGIGDYNYFAKVFKMHFHVSASSLRKTKS